jgi:hypothetical protein
MYIELSMSARPVEMLNKLAWSMWNSLDHRYKSRGFQEKNYLKFLMNAETKEITNGVKNE